jgi:tRNA threonylcarbamoyladenosine biosynthesis protein TsaB
MMTLAIETSTIRGSVAALEDGKVIFSDQFTADRSHSSELFTILERALIVLHRCDQIVVGLGPGSYSGVRIGIAAAIGLQYGLQARLAGIPSSIAMATDAVSYHAVGDARRETFYHARVVEGICVEEPSLLTSAELKAKIESHTLPVFSSDAIPEISSLQTAFPSAEKLARLAEQGCGIVSHGDLEPIYLRDPHITTPRKA